MRARRFLVGLTTALIAVGCSSKSDGPLDKVSSGVANDLCADFFVVLRDSAIFRQGFDTDRFAEVAGRYSELSATSRAVNARDFGHLAEDASDAGDALADAQKAGNTEFSAELRAMALRLDLAETGMELACAERGLTQYDDVVPTDGAGGSAPTTTR